MPSPFDSLCGPAGPLRAEPPDAAEFAGLVRCHRLRNLGEYECDLSIDARIVADLVVACHAVALKVRALPPVEGS